MSIAAGPPIIPPLPHVPTISTSDILASLTTITSTTPLSPAPFTPRAVAVSAPGKVLLAGGFLVVDRAHTGLVFGLDARIAVLASTIQPAVEGVHLNEIVVESPQFPGATWRYGYHLTAEEDGGGMRVTQLVSGAESSPNPFVETTLNYALTYISRSTNPQSMHSMPSTRLVILADNDYYSLPDSSPVSYSSSSAAADSSAAAVDNVQQTRRYSRFPAPLSQIHKTGLGSSAALVTALSAALLSHYLAPVAFDLETIRDRQRLHNLAQAAHCAVQTKVGSGFDVAAAVWGGCIYRRFSPSILESVPAVGKPGFGLSVVRIVDAETKDNVSEHDASDNPVTWDVQIRRGDVSLPPSVSLRMCDVDHGSQTVGMVKAVFAWRAADPSRSSPLWSALQSANDELAHCLRNARLDELPAAIAAVRALVREMSQLAGVPIEPPSQTRLLDALTQLEGVYGGVVPGAGGFDALAVLMRDDGETEKRVIDFLTGWKWDTATGEKGGRVRLLGVRGEETGIKAENVDLFNRWL